MRINFEDYYPSDVEERNVSAREESPGHYRVQWVFDVCGMAQVHVENFHGGITHEQLLEQKEIMENMRDVVIDLDKEIKAGLAVEFGNG